MGLPRHGKLQLFCSLSEDFKALLKRTTQYIFSSYKVENLPSAPAFLSHFITQSERCPHLLQKVILRFRGIYFFVSFPALYIILE